MIRRPTRSTSTNTLFPSPTLFRAWLSREGVLAMTSYAPALGLMSLIWLGALSLPAQALGFLLALMALATVSATAMIYASLPTIPAWHDWRVLPRSEEHTSELQSLMRISYAVFCLKKKKKHIN